jgi:hypothetical protein
MCGGDGRGNAGCRIVPIKIAPGRSGSATSFDIARAILYAVARRARAVNLSFAGPGESALERAALYDAVTRGCVVVAAAGNRGSAAPQYPAAYAADGLCLQVGASDESDRPCAFSSFGPGLDVLAPGVDVWTTFMTYPSAAGARYPGYVAAAGTSFAAPFAAGAVGLLAAARPELTDTDFQRLIRESAHDLGPPGRDATTGWGRLDAAAALDAAEPALGIWHDEVGADVALACDHDTLIVGDPGPGTLSVLRGARPAWRFTCETVVALPDSFLGPVRVWPRVGGTMTVRPGFRLPYFAPWGEVAAATVDGSALPAGARAFTLRGDLYRVDDAALPPGDEDAWVPVPPDQARFGFTVIGRVDRPPSVRVLAPPPGAVVAAGESLAVRWQASDPDTVTAIEIWLAPARGAPIPLASLAGDRAAATVALPCAAESTAATLRVIARDERGRQHDAGAAEVALALRPGGCADVGAAPPVAALRARPNPAQGRVRFHGAGALRIAIADLAGRVVARITLDAASGEAIWDGRTSAGALAPPGLYLARAEPASASPALRIVWLGAPR